MSLTVFFGVCVFMSAQSNAQTPFHDLGEQTETRSTVHADVRDTSSEEILRFQAPNNAIAKTTAYFHLSSFPREGVFELQKIADNTWSLGILELDTALAKSRPLLDQSVETTPNSDSEDPNNGCFPTLETPCNSFVHDNLATDAAYETCEAALTTDEDSFWDYVVGLKTPPGYWWDGATSGTAQADWNGCGWKDASLLVEISWYGEDLRWDEGSNPNDSIPENTPERKAILLRTDSVERARNGRFLHIDWCILNTVTGHITKRRIKTFLFVPKTRIPAIRDTENFYILTASKNSAMIPDKQAPAACTEFSIE